jgi:hypothetical protein
MKKRIRSMNAYKEIIEYYGVPITIYYSYNTPIIVETNGFMITSPIKYSRTTSKQKAGLLNNKVVEVNHAIFRGLLTSLGIELGWA